MEKNQIESLNDIRNLMEKSSRFLSLSGLSGISAGIIALIGATVAFFYFDFDQRYFDRNSFFIEKNYCKLSQNIDFLFIDAAIILLLAISSGIFFTIRKTRKSGLKVWNSTSKRLLVNLFIPLAAGGLFCLILTWHGLIFLLAPTTLIFYGLALLNASKYTLRDIRYLGVSELILGLIGSVFTGYGLLIWAIGFGLLHIVYGTRMYFKYDRA